MSAVSAETPSKPTLATLPPELMKLIISDPFNLGGTNTKRKDPYQQQWLGIKLKYPKPYRQDDGPDATEVMNTLRALSQTCRSLRNFTLPLIWAVASVSTIDQLGRMCQVLRADPSIAAHIKSFSFSWDMDGDYFHCDAHTQKEAGSLLDLAFTNRLKLWDSLRRKYGCKVEWEGGGEESLAKWFTHDGRMYDAPGLAEPIKGKMDKWGLPVYNPRASNVGGNGPDGSGEDKLIKTPTQFNECITEVMSQLSNLQKFSWKCPVAPMPEDALNALAKLNSLTALYLNISTYRGQVHNLPYWRLTRKLECLSFDFNESYHSSPGDNDKDEESKDEEPDEAAYASFELPASLPTTNKAIKALHFKVASRTIIAALRNGHLKRLSSSGGQVQAPFAMRTLLPLVVKLESLSMKEEYGGAKGWVLAASSLRPLLAHASLWLHTPSNKDRLLTQQDVQALQAHFKTAGIPQLIAPIYSRSGSPHPVESYLRWLAEDEQLAQQVADSWTTVVESGQLEQIQCYCDKCKEYKKKQKKA